MDLTKVIKDVPDFPIKGVIFRDITPVLHDPDAFRAAVDSITQKLKNVDFDYIAGPESRGYLFATPISYNMGKGFIPVRKAGKLPRECYRAEYDLEYGTAAIEIHKDSIKSGDKVVVVDDLLATGGTAKAVAELVESAGGEVVLYVFMIELTFLNGRDMLKGYNVQSILTY